MSLTPNTIRPSQKKQHARRFILKDDTEVADSIAIFALLLQNGHLGLPMSNLGMRRADLYKVPKTKHFSPHHGKTNPAVLFYQQNSGVNDDPESPTASRSYNDDSELYEDEDDPTNSSYRMIEMENSSFSIDVTQSTPVEETFDTITPKKQILSDINELTPPRTVPYQNKTFTYSTSSTGFQRKVSSDSFDIQNSFPPVYKQSSSKSTDKRFTPPQSSFTRSNVFGQKIPVYRKKTVENTPANSVRKGESNVQTKGNIFRPDTPTTQINKKLNLFRVQTPLKRDGEPQSAPNIDEPKTPIEQTGSYSFDTSYDMPISSQKSRIIGGICLKDLENSRSFTSKDDDKKNGEIDTIVLDEEDTSAELFTGNHGRSKNDNASGVSIKANTSGFRVRKRSDMLDSPFKTPVRNRSPDKTKARHVSMFQVQISKSPGETIKRPTSTQPVSTAEDSSSSK